MPLDHSGSCDALHSNFKHLYEKFKGEGKDDEKARSMAFAAAARICRDNGGSPESCSGSKG